MRSLENAENLDAFIAFLLTVFCDLLQKYTVGSSQTFLYCGNFVGGVAPSWILGPRVMLLCANLHRAHGKAGCTRVRVDTQYVARVSHVRTATTKGDFPLEEMSV